MTLLPLKYPTLWGWYKKMQATFWTFEEIEASLASDRADLKTLTEMERRMLEIVLSFFAIADSLIMENVSCNFAEEVKAPEALLVYAFQNMMEGVHVETYNRTIELYFGPDTHLLKMEHGLIPYKSVEAKKVFCEQWMDKQQAFATRLVAFACVEGLFFTSAFAFIFWFKKHNRLSGLTVSNELIARDEALHAGFAVALHRELQKENQCDAGTIERILRDAVEVEIVFVLEVFENATLDDLTSDDLIAWVKIVANKLMSDFGLSALYDIAIPDNMVYMEVGAVDLKTNFFEERVTSYSKHEPDPIFSNDTADF